MTGRWIGVDWGTANPTHAVLVVERVDADDADARVRYVEREWRHPGGEHDSTIEDKAAAILGTLSSRR